MTLPNATLEICPKDQKFFDYCLWPYEPLKSLDNKAHSINQLFNSFDVADMPDEAKDFVRTIQKEIGKDKTVWGVKYLNGHLNWEFYFYDYQRLERSRSISRILKASLPYFKCPVSAPERSPYFMFSIDVDSQLVQGRRDLEEINMYIGNVGGDVSAGICYSLTKDDCRLGNHYYFFDRQSSMDDITAKIACSAYLELGNIKIDEILWPQLIDCKTIVVANKKANDAVYFSRINIEQLLYFFKRLGYPKGIIDHIESNRSRYDHLLYDVGIDYRMSNGELEILKSGYYGVF